MASRKACDRMFILSIIIIVTTGMCITHLTLLSLRLTQNVLAWSRKGTTLCAQPSSLEHPKHGKAIGVIQTTLSVSLIAQKEIRGRYGDITIHAFTNMVNVTPC